MRLHEAQRRFGLLFGMAAFATGLLLTHLITPSGFISGAPRWQAVTWLYLNAHGVPIAASNFQQFAWGQSIGLMGRYQVPSSVTAIPILLSTIYVIVTIDAIGYTTRFKHILENGAYLLLGYVLASGAGVAVSGARPAVTLLIILFLGTGVAIYIGSIVVQNLTGGLPFFGVVTLGTVLITGLVILIGGATIVLAFLPIVVIGGIGVLSGSILSYIARNVN
jgi:hypothetical protein